MNQDTSGWTKSSWAILGAALLVLLGSIVLMLYRAALPTDGREWLEPAEVGFYLEGGEIVAIEGLPVTEILRDSITLHPRRPARWAVGQSVTYTLQDGSTRSFTLEQGTVKVMEQSTLWYWLSVLVGLLQLGLGSFVFARRPAHPAPRLLFLLGVVLMAGAIHSSVTNEFSGPRVTDYFYVGAYWPTLFFDCVASGLLPLLLHFFMVFPEVKKPLRRHPRLIPALLYLLGVLELGSDTVYPLTWWLGDWFGLLSMLWFLLLLMGIVVSAGHTLLTLRQTGGSLKMRWVAWAVAIPLLYFLLVFLTILIVVPAALLGWYSRLDPIMQIIDGLLSGAGIFSYVAFPIFLMVAILRYRLFGIDLLLNRTLVYGALTGIVAGLYALVVGVPGALLNTQGQMLFSVLLTGLIAVLFQPLRERLQRGVNRLMYGERDEPVTVLTRLGQRLESALAAEAALPTIVETVAQSLKLPYVAISLQGEGETRIAATYGLPVDEALRLPLTYQGETIGHLLLAARAPGETFTPGDLRLLENVARQAGAAAHAVRLTAALQHSRERLVLAREEERRRLRRDLHDGLGPQLAGLTLRLDAARNLLARDPQATGQLLLELKTQTQAAIGDVRRLVYDLRPPALDQLGLPGALQEYAATHNAAHGLRIVVEAPTALPPLPAAVEVAAYRIAMEAMTNVARHAQAQHCWVRLTLDAGLNVEICDDGVGLPAAYQAGVGLTSMRERAAELGGICEIEPRDGGGVRVLACLPLPRET